MSERRSAWLPINVESSGGHWRESWLGGRNATRRAGGVEEKGPVERNGRAGAARGEHGAALAGGGGGEE